MLSRVDFKVVFIQNGRCISGGVLKLLFFKIELASLPQTTWAVCRLAALITLLTFSLSWSLYYNYYFVDPLNTAAIIFHLMNAHRDVCLEKHKIGRGMEGWGDQDLLFVICDGSVNYKIVRIILETVHFKENHCFGANFWYCIMISIIMINNNHYGFM